MNYDFDDVVHFGIHSYFGGLCLLAIFAIIFTRIGKLMAAESLPDPEEPND